MIPRIGIDNYSLTPLELDPMATLKWAREHGAEGVQFSGLTPENRALCTPAYLNDLALAARDHDLYIEWGGARHIPLDMETWEKTDIVPVIRQSCQEARTLGTGIVRSCSGGLMRWDTGNPSTEYLLDETAGLLRECRSMIMDHGTVLAIETHFEFTTFELLRLFEACGARPGEYLGIDLDTMNLLTMLEDPLAATERILPWVAATHVKDGGLFLHSRGITTFPASPGRGIIDLETILMRLSSLGRPINWSIEDHGGEFALPVFDPLFLSRFPDLSAQEFARLIGLSVQTRVRMESGECAMTARDEWPSVCEERVQQDIEMLKAMRARLEPAS